jgi:hypothetical protein
MEGLSLLRQGITLLGEQPAEAFTDEQLVAEMRELHELESMLAAQRARRAAIVDDRKLWRADGSKAFWAWLTRSADMSPAAAKALVRLSRGLRLAPLTRAAFESGDIDRDRAVELARRADSPRKQVADAFPEAEAQLLDAATTLTFEGSGRVLRYWESLVDEDGEEDQAEDDYLSRHLHASEILRGMVRIDGLLDPVGGAIFVGELARIEQQLFDADWAAAKAVHGDDTRPEHLPRSPGQRRADALTEMARRSATHQPRFNGDGQPRPLFSVHIGPDTVTRLCELASGTMIAPGLLVPYLGEADIERIIYGPGSRTIDLSKRAPFFRGGVRRVIELRDRWCAHPGCTTLAEDCQIDHVQPRSHGGETTQANGRPLCDTHNRWQWNHHQRHRTSATGAGDDEPPSTPTR